MELTDLCIKMQKLVRTYRQKNHQQIEKYHPKTYACLRYLCADELIPETIIRVLKQAQDRESIPLRLTGN